MIDWISKKFASSMMNRFKEYEPEIGRAMWGSISSGLKQGIDDNILTPMKNNPVTSVMLEGISKVNNYIAPYKQIALIGLAAYFITSKLQKREKPKTITEKMMSAITSQVMPSFSTCLKLSLLALVGGGGYIMKNNLFPNDVLPKDFLQKAQTLGLNHLMGHAPKTGNEQNFSEHLQDFLPDFLHNHDNDHIDYTVKSSQTNMEDKGLEAMQKHRLGLLFGNPLSKIQGEK